MLLYKVIPEVLRTSFVSIRPKIVAHVQVHQMQLKQILQVDFCGTFSRSDGNGETVTTWGGRISSTSSEAVPVFLRGLVWKILGKLWVVGMQHPDLRTRRSSWYAHSLSNCAVFNWPSRLLDHGWQKNWSQNGLLRQRLLIHGVCLLYIYIMVDTVFLDLVFQILRNFRTWHAIIHHVNGKCWESEKAAASWWSTEVPYIPWYCQHILQDDGMGGGQQLSGKPPCSSEEEEIPEPMA